uniref:G-protein coupled receptors family 2 profile 2 domain-containing protein n=2 Tax=Clytia hemisphaerica TaxID=252671 RepID=A0A7M5XGT6_9CNID
MLTSAVVITILHLSISANQISNHTTNNSINITSIISNVTGAQNSTNNVTDLFIVTGTKNSSTTFNNSTGIVQIDQEAIRAKIAEEARLLALIKRQVTIEYYTRTISYFFVWISVITLFSLKLPKSSKFFVHKQLLLSYLLSDSLLLFFHDDNRWRFLGNRPLCIGSAILVHYFSTTVYTSMLVEGLHICFKLKTVFESAFETRRHLFYAFIAWGIPFVSTSITTGIYFKDFTMTTSCYSLPTAEAKWKWKGPVAVILSINMLCFMFVQYIIFKSLFFAKSLPTRNYNKIRSMARSVTAIMPLLGISFILGFFIEYNLEIIGYIFVVSNGVLGFLFFVFHVLLDKQVRVQFKKQVFGRKDLKISSTQHQEPKRKETVQWNRRLSCTFDVNRRSIKGRTNESMTLEEDDEIYEGEFTTTTTHMEDTETSFTVMQVQDSPQL